ncbi:MAG: lamin tail domain-containing protein [Kiritimatiellae bacterium]|nr:lamin tail domain-containing protein [Kiritimatiellia bacterium]
MLYCSTSIADIVINEFLADNATTVADPEGDKDDWIELYNGGTTDIDVAGMYLTDNLGNPTKHLIDTNSLIIGPDDHLLFWADEDTDDGPMHLNFKLAASGEQIGLYNTDGSTLIDSITFGQQLPDISYGRYPDGSDDWRSMNIPTPDDVNDIGAAGPVDVSEPSRTFMTTLSVTLTATNNPDGIRYTLDGSVPTGSSSAYGSALTITNSTILRARAFKSGMEDGPVVSSHYILLADDAIRTLQSKLPILLVDSFGGAIPNNDPRQFTYMAIFEPGTNGLTSVTNLPTLSTRAGMEYRGNSTINAPKKQLRIETWLDDRDEEKDISPFGMSSDGDWLTISGYGFDYALMRPSLMFDLDRQIGNWSPRTIFVEVFINTSGGAMSYAGSYQGVSAFGEEISRAADRIDLARLDPDDTTEPDVTGGYMFENDREVDFGAGGLSLNWEYPGPQTMNSAPYATQKQWLIDYMNEAKAVLDGAGFDDPETGYAKYIDVESYIDYHWFTFLAEDPDAYRYSTFYHKHRGGKLRMGPHWDFDRTMESTDGRDNNPFSWLRSSGNADYFKWGWLNRLFQDVDFWQQWIDRWFEHRDGTLSTTNVNAVINSMSNSIGTEAAARNFAKWENPRTSGGWASGELDGTWSGEVRHMAAYLEARSSWIDDRFLARPTYNQDGGFITGGSELVISGPVGATTYYTLDGTDPRAPGGAPSASALEYTAPLLLSNNVIVVSRAFDSTWVNGAWQTGDLFATTLPWSAPGVSVFAVAPHTVAVTEVMYNPRDPELGTAETNYPSSDFEFVEISNTSIEPVYLAGLRFTDGIAFDWSYGQVRSLAVGESAIAVNNLDAFKLRYPNWATMNIAGAFEGTLNNGGEQIRLDSYTGTIYAWFAYNSSRGWPVSARGAGHSLVPLITGDQSTRLLDYGGNWRASGLVDGSPGLPDPAPGIHVTINEIAAHTDTGLPAPDDSDDWIELHNPSGTPVDVSGWYISDDDDRLTQVVLPAGSIIATNGFMTLRESTHFHTNRLDGSGFGLNKGGESVFLSRDTGSGLQVVDAVAFKGQPNGPTLGRYADSGDYLYELAATTNTPNAAPQLHVVISELMVHPLVDTNEPTHATTHEYVELLNPLSTNVALSTEAGAWRLDGGVDFVFPTNTTLAPSEYVLVVGFDPQDSVTLTDFIDSYGLTNGQVRIFGPYTGRLDNRTERVALERPQEADQLGAAVSWIIVDEVIYFVDTPWPTGTAGTGGSLQRSVSASSGRDPGNWIGAIEGTPGVPGTLLAIASPASGTRYFVPDTVAISVAIEALRVSNAVSQVEFLDGSNVLCVVTQEPYSCELNINDVRSYFLSAEMTDGAGVHTSRLVIVDGLQINALAPTGVTDVAAFYVGALEGNGSASASLYWGDEDGAEDAVAWDHIVSRTANGGTPISIPIDHLTAGRTYYYRYRAEVAGRFAWSSNTVSFSTTPLSEWPYHLPLQFPGAPASPLTDFPVLIKLHEGISGFSYSQFSSPDGFDLRVGAGSNGEAIPYEIEHWDTGGVSYVWALVPELSTGTWVNVHWGNPVAATQPPPYATDSSLWRDDYAAVWHLNADLSDAANHQADAVSTGSLAAGGVVAGGRIFDGIDDVLHQGPSTAWYSQHMQDMTISVWIHPTQIGGVPFGAAVAGDTTQDFGFKLNTHPFVRNLFANIDGAITQFGQFNLNEWHLLTLTVSNGVLFAAQDDVTPVQVGPLGGFLPTRQPTLGNLAGGDDPFTGSVDELRVSATTRSAAWIRTTYRTIAEHDSFTTYGSVVSGGPFVDADGNGLPDAWEQHFFGISGIDEEGHGDADPMDNRSEYVAGTDPTNSADFFWLGIQTGAVNPVFYFTTRLTEGEGYEGIDRFYALEDRAVFSTGLWSHLPGADRIPATGTTFVYSNAVPATNATRQYRSKVWLEDTP